MSLQFIKLVRGIHVWISRILYEINYKWPSSKPWLQKQKNDFCIRLWPDGSVRWSIILYTKGFWVQSLVASQLMFLFPPFSNQYTYPWVRIFFCFFKCIRPHWLRTKTFNVTGLREQSYLCLDNSWSSKGSLQGRLHNIGVSQKTHMACNVFTLSYV